MRVPGPLAVVTLDAPPLNLFDEPMLAGLRAAMDGLEAQAPRGVLFRAEGRVVSGGVDVHLFDGLSPETAAGLWEDLLGLIARVEALRHNLRIIPTAAFCDREQNRLIARQYFGPTVAAFFLALGQRLR